LDYGGTDCYSSLGPSPISRGASCDSRAEKQPQEGNGNEEIGDDSVHDSNDDSDGDGDLVEFH